MTELLIVLTYVAQVVGLGVGGWALLGLAGSDQW